MDYLDSDLEQMSQHKFLCFLTFFDGRIRPWKPIVLENGFPWLSRFLLRETNLSRWNILQLWCYIIVTFPCDILYYFAASNTFLTELPGEHLFHNFSQSLGCLKGYDSWLIL